MEISFKNESGIPLTISVNGGIVDSVNDQESMVFEVEDGDVISAEETEEGEGE